ncbi:3899_t:CDS:2 [Dentiscutata heterogama]|uniref:3899_t:CDS:1 n=1 Tax=Dentiscutata heterogama TaxID=1316150 RepID=A0ACA9KKJ8_9GLOM|nr:3899_t:CDS:2 [Dentiscutata heterogama]
MASSSFQFSSDNHQVQYQETDHIDSSYLQFFLDNYQQNQFFSEDHSEVHQFSLRNQQKRYQDIHSEIHQERYQLPLEINQQYQENAYNAKVNSFFEEPWLIEKESQLNERESQLNERESQLNKKESLFEEERSQHKTAIAFLAYLSNLFGNDFLLYYVKFRESLQDSPSFLEMKEEGCSGHRAVVPLCRSRRRKAVSRAVQKQAQNCLTNGGDVSHVPVRRHGMDVAARYTVWPRTERGKRKVAACDICRDRKKRCVGGKVGEEPCEYCSKNKKDCSYIR